MSLTMRCEPCGKCFTGPVSYNQHVESDKHKRKVSSLNIFSNLNEKKIVDTSEIVLPSSVQHSSNRLECSTCNLTFNSSEDLERHSLTTHTKENAQIHVENANNKVSILVSSSAHPSNVVSNSREISDKSDTILPEVEMFKSQASYSFCDTCKKCFSGPESYKQHIESIGHIKKTHLEKKISLGINVVAAELSCAPCNKTFSGPVPYDQHMNSEIHKKKIQSLQLLEKMEVDSNIKVNTIVLEPGPLNKENNPWYCKTCDVICSGPAPLAQHNNGSTHLKNFKAQREKHTDDTLRDNLQINGWTNSKEDIILPGLVDDNNKVPKLDELITVFLPEEEIDFDVQKINTNLKSAKAEDIDSNEQSNKINLKLLESPDIDLKDQNETNLKLYNKNPNELELNQVTLDACSIIKEEKENISKIPIKGKSDVFQVCSYCNVELYDKDELVNHFESEEHFHKRWSKNL